MIDRKFLPFSTGACCGDREIHSRSSAKDGECGCSGNSQTLSSSSNVNPINGISWGPGVLDLSRSISTATPFSGTGGNGGFPSAYWRCDEYTCCTGSYGIALNGKWTLFLDCFSRTDNSKRWHFEIQA